ncbi:hypothetical protein JVU11DRAFT_3701 [Chiua virens]|nr:hypothetical protein JVU11DRAFT_3701 [Chiua virens]
MSIYVDPFEYRIMICWTSPPTPNVPNPIPFRLRHFTGFTWKVEAFTSLAYERKWGSHFVISVDAPVLKLIPHVETISLTPSTFSSLSVPGQSGQSAPLLRCSAPTPHAILLSLARHAPSHALLVPNAIRDGATILRLPTSKAPDRISLPHLSSQPPPHPAERDTSNSNVTRTRRRWDGVGSICSGSGFWLTTPTTCSRRVTVRRSNVQRRGRIVCRVGNRSP